MPPFEQPIIVPKGTVFESYRVLTPAEEAKLGSEESKRTEKGDARLSGNMREQLDRAREMFGKDFLGPEVVEAVWGVRLEARNIPPIPFSREELLRAKELDQQLVLRVNKAPDGTALTMEKMNELLQPKLTQGGKGRLLISVDWYANEDFFKKETPESTWALVSKGEIPNSLGQNYLEQTDTLAAYIKDELFKGKSLPREYVEALQEFDSKKGALASLIESDWKEAAKQLSELKINQLVRPTPADALYDTAMNLAHHNERYLENSYTWTNRRSSGGYLLFVGYADAVGAHVHRLEPDDRNGYLGVSFSRSR